MKDHFEELAERWAYENGFDRMENGDRIIEAVADLLRREIEQERATHRNRIQAIVADASRTTTARILDVVTDAIKKT